jgi:D-proline reductase (dithiol) PrdB
MARLADLNLAYRLFMQAYPYRQIDWRPGSLLHKPLSESTLAVVTTAAFYHSDQPPFDRTVRGGDYSFREIPLDTDLASLGIAHKSDAFDHSGIEADRNLALPLDRLRELAARGVIAAPARRHFSFMGSLTAPGRLIDTTAPEVARQLVDDKVDAVLLTPV